MAYDSIINKNQGAAKISEVFTDRALDIIKTQIGESAIIALEQLVRVSGDALRRINYILYSPGTINWTGSVIEQNNIATPSATDIIFRLLQTEDIGIVTSPRHVDLVLTGSQTTNGELTFQNMPLSNGEVIYLELDRATVLGAGTSKPLHNAVSGSSIFSGLTVKKTTVASGLPALASQIGSATNTFIIPLFMRVDWTDGTDSFQDLWAIPHGIRWLAGTRSALGGVIVSGLDHYYSKIVANQAQLIQAITDLTATGGIILIKAPIALNTSVTIPTGVTLTSRSNKYTTAEGGITISPGASIILADGAKLQNCDIEGTSSFIGGSDTLVSLANTKAEVRDCNFKLINTTGTPACISAAGFLNRIYNCNFTISSAAGNVGIKYTSVAGHNNSDTDSRFI